MWGPLLGAVLLTALPEILRPLKDARLIIDGLVLVVASIYLPWGIVGALQRIRLSLGRQPRLPEGDS